MSIGHAGAAHHAGQTLDLPGHDEVNKGLPAAAQESLQASLADAGEGVLVAVVLEQVHGHRAPAGLVGGDDLVDDPVPVLLAGLVAEGDVLRVGFLGHHVQADLLDLQLLADGFNAGQGAVELREHRVNGPAGEHGLGDVVVARVAVENLRVVGPPELEVLAHAGAAHQLEALGSRSLGLGHYVLVQEAVLDVGEQGVLVAGDEDVDVVGVNNVHAHGGGTDLRVPQHHVVEEVSELESVEARGHAQAQAAHQHLHRIGAQIGGGLDDIVEYLPLGAAGHDAQLLPALHPGGVGQLLHQLHGLVLRPVQVREHRIRHLHAQIVLVCSCDAKNLRQMVQGFLAADLVPVEAGVLQLPGGVLHHVDVAAGPGGHSPQEVPGHDGVRAGPADAPGGVGRDAAGPVGAQAAAHALEAKAALGPLGLHPVVGGLHGQAADVLLHGLIRAGAGVAAEAVGTVVHRMAPPFINRYGQQSLLGMVREQACYWGASAGFTP